MSDDEEADGDGQQTGAFCRLDSAFDEWVLRLVIQQPDRLKAKLLRVLAEFAPVPVTAVRAAEQLDFDQDSAGRSMRSLERLGLVERVGSRYGRPRWTVTPAGLVVVDELRIRKNRRRARARERAAAAAGVVAGSGWSVEMMLKRKQKQKDMGLDAGRVVVEGDVAAVQAAREALVARVHGEWEVARRVVAEDPVLAGRLEVAIEAGMAVLDLAGVPLYRRPAYVEEQLEVFETATAGGPCSFCGCRSRRFGFGPFRLLDSHEPPAFKVRGDGTTACGWCADAITSWGVEGFAQRAYLEAVGAGGSSSSRKVRFAHESADAVAVRGDGSPWSYLDRAGLHADAVAHGVFLERVRRGGASGWPGLPREWDAPPVPAYERTWADVGSVSSKARREADAAAVARWERDRRVEEARRARDHASLVERDRRWEKLTPEELADAQSWLARDVAADLARAKAHA